MLAHQHVRCCEVVEQAVGLAPRQVGCGDVDVQHPPCTGTATPGRESAPGLHQMREGISE
jgi:hypothetical protein